MIQGDKKTEANYREITLDSSSSLKDFSMDRKKYFKKYILGETIREKENQAVNMGKIVETLLLEPEEFENKFYLSNNTKIPTGLMLDFVNALFVLSIEAKNEAGESTRPFEDIALDAHKASGFKLPFDTVIKKFSETEAVTYFNELLEVDARKLTIVTLNDVTFAERIVDSLKTNFVTQKIINLESDKRYTVMNQFQIENYVVCGHRFKSMIDKVVVDNESKEITPYDLKCTWNVENFFEEYYLYRRAYIQGFLYTQALVSMVENPQSPYFGYKVNYTQFIVCDSSNYYNPLIFKMEQKQISDAMYGFTFKDRTYPGVKLLIEELAWAQESNIWDISKSNYDSDGICKLE